MRLGILRLSTRTTKSLSYAAAGFTCLLFFLGFCALLAFALSPEAQEAQKHLWR
jgi:hypothetical protein